MIMRLWESLDARMWNVEKKQRFFRLFLALEGALIGIVLWLLLCVFVSGLRTFTWLICFVGYPVIASWFVAVFYTIRHEFCDTDADEAGCLQYDDFR